MEIQSRARSYRTMCIFRYNENAAKQFAEMCKRGATYQELMEEFHIGFTTVWRYKMILGVPKPPRYYRYYTIYKAATDELLAYGTAQECAKTLRVNVSKIYQMAHCAKTGKVKKYDILVEPVVEEEGAAV